MSAATQLVLPQEQAFIHPRKAPGRHPASAMLPSQPHLPDHWRGAPGQGPRQAPTASQVDNVGGAVFGAHVAVPLDAKAQTSASAPQCLQQLSCRRADLQNFEGLFLCLDRQRLTAPLRDRCAWSHGEDWALSRHSACSKMNGAPPGSRSVSQWVIKANVWHSRTGQVLSH